jgi:hypothetical protein
MRLDWMKEIPVPLVRFHEEYPPEMIPWLMERGGVGDPLFTVSVLAYGRLDCTVPCVNRAPSMGTSSCLTDNNSQDGTSTFKEIASRAAGRPPSSQRRQPRYQIPHRGAPGEKGRFFVISATTGA